MNKKVAFIGAGNMASAVIGGIINSKLIDASNVYVSNPSNGKLERLKAEYGLNTSNDNCEVARNGEDLVFLCVKPIFLLDEINEIKDSIGENTTVVSVAAGKSLAVMEEAFGKKVKLIRVMPNTPALVGEGCSAVVANEEASKPENRQVFDEVCEICRSFGEVVEVPERLIDVAGQVGGASPAWIFMVIEALADGAVAEGMPRDMAYKFAISGVAGAGKLAQKKNMHPGALKDMVTSPGGTTIQGVRTLEERGVRGAFIDAVINACEKAKTL